MRQRSHDLTYPYNNASAFLHLATGLTHTNDTANSFDQEHTVNEDARNMLPNIMELGEELQAMTISATYELYAAA